MRANVSSHTILAIAISVVAVAVRFININQPFIDDWSWRQSDVASIARNFLSNGFHFAYPQIDWAGDQAGYVGTEFPILPFAAALSYQVLGVHEWIGRLQSVIFFAASLPFLYLLVRDTFGGTGAIWALVFYSFAPLNLMASRCFMPDVPSLSLSIIGLQLFSSWTAGGGLSRLLLAAIAISLSLLIKLPSVLIGAPLLCLAYQRFGLSLFRRIELWIFAAIVLVPSVAWYWHCHRIAQTFYPYHFFGAGGLRLMDPIWYATIAEQTVIWSLSAVLSVMAAVGVCCTSAMKRAWFFHCWLIAMLAFIVAVGYGNRHPWYQLPLVPIAAAFAGASYTLLHRLSRRRLRWAAGAIVITFGILCYAGAKRFYRESAADLRLLGLELRRSTPQKSLVIAADYGDPTVFYYAERRGWHFAQDEGIYNGHPLSSGDAIADVEALRRKGATHFVVYTGSLWWLDYYKEFTAYLMATSKLTEQKPQFAIYAFESPAR